MEYPASAIKVPAKGTIAVKYKDVFHLQNLYEIMHFWLEDRNWGPKGSHEDLYVEKWYPNDSIEHVIRWNMNKIPDESGYFKYTIMVEMHTLAIKPKDMVVEGKKLSGVVEGEIEIRINPLLHLDYGGKFGKTFAKSKLMGPFHSIFHQRIFKGRIDALKLDLYNEMYEFEGMIKNFLQLKQFITMHDQQLFHPSKSFPE